MRVPVTRRRQHRDAPLGRRRCHVPFTVDAEVVRRDGRRSVGDVHLRAEVRIGANEERTLLTVERKESDVDVTSCTEDAAWFPVKAPVVVQKDSDTFEVWHQLVGSVCQGGQQKVCQGGQQKVFVVYTHICAFVHTRMHVHTYVHMYTRACTYTHTCMCTHTHARTHMRACAHTRMHVHTYVHVYTHACTYTHTCMCTHTHARTHIRACVHTRMHVHTYVHVYTHACTFTHKHTQITYIP